MVITTVCVWRGDHHGGGGVCGGESPLRHAVCTRLTYGWVPIAVCTRLTCGWVPIAVCKRLTCGWVPIAVCTRLTCGWVPIAVAVARGSGGASRWVYVGGRSVRGPEPCRVGWPKPWVGCWRLRLLWWGWPCPPSREDPVHGRCSPPLAVCSVQGTAGLGRSEALEMS